jgi:hexulose-6-phosphate isomerase
MENPMNRRDFLTTSAALAVGAAAVADTPAKPKLKKAVKYAMIAGNAPVREKFELIKRLGFQGVETDSPSGLNKEEAVKAVADTGIQVHGVIDSVHWRDTLSHPDEKVRAKGLAALEGALQDAKVLGANTVLLVPGVVNKEVTYQQCWDRSQAEVRKALPLAEKLGVKIAIEVVWNNFITKPEQWVEYIDAFKSPFVGGYFDCSNMIKYGVPSATWIRTAGKRILKFDFKGYSKAKAKAAGNDGAGFNVGIGEGDEDWPEIVKALAEVGYNGWATAEVASGGEPWLKDVSERMNKILEL